MGRIKKSATERHTATLSPFVSDFVAQTISISLHELPQKLSGFPQHWPFPRGDLYHWIPLLDRFDHVLELFNKEYALNEGPQTQPFERRLLQKGDAEEGMPYPAKGAEPQELDAAGCSEEGDAELVEAIVHFTRVLLEHCGNRSLYASSGHVNDLLNTTSLSLLRLSLKLALRLAQRYQVARYKNASPHAQASLLANHYAFTFDSLHRIAMPFPKPAGSSTAQAVATPGKGKEKAAPVQTFNPSDLVTIAKQPQALASKGDIGSVSMSYYDQSAASTSRPATAQQPSEASPNTPTPARRTSNLGPSRDRPSAGERTASATDVITPAKSRELDTSSSTAPQVFQIPSAKVAETPSWALVRDALPSVPTELRYDLLNRIRIAKAFTSPELPTQQLLEVRLLAIANLAYSLGESKFQEKVGVPDSEEPRRYHIAQQLADLLQPASSGQVGLSLDTETTVILTLEALLKSRQKLGEVIDALAITVNHGVLYYELRKVIATLHVQEHPDRAHELRELEWREATFDLINNLQLHNSHARTGERLVAAGIIGILVEVLSLRTTRAERFHERVLGFFSAFIHNIQNALQTFGNDKGFDMLADLVQYEVDTALQSIKSGNGLKPEFKSKVVDYEIPYAQQSTLRVLFKFIVTMFESHQGAQDRQLRNLIDTPHVLGPLKAVIEDSKIFGSNVWTGAVNIMTMFIHNEPTSYQVVGEAGLPKAFLEALLGQRLPEDLPADYVPTENDLHRDVEFEDGEPLWPNVDGILPVGETLGRIPDAFGAICLNENGMSMFQASKALIKYFDVFLSPAHIRALVDEDGMAANIGASFDELTRHQPRLKGQILMSVASMIRRVVALCRKMAEYKAVGAKLWRKSPSEPDHLFLIEGGNAALAGASPGAFEEARDTDTPFSPTAKTVQTTSQDTGEVVAEKGETMRFVSAVAGFLSGFFHNNSLPADFCIMGGVECLLDLIVLPSNPVEFKDFGAYKPLVSVLKSMCEAKAHLVLPSILRRTENALMGVEPLIDGTVRVKGLFASFVDFSKDVDSPFPQGLDGTTVLKCLANVDVLADLLGKVLAPPAYTSRHSTQTSQLFANLNFTDVYVKLVDDLGKLHASCLWESLALQQTVSQELKDKTDPQVGRARRVDANNYCELVSESRLSESQSTGSSNGSSKQLSDEEVAIKNIKALRYVLEDTPKGITTFMHTLGQALVPRRSNELSTKQHASLVAERIAKSMLWELDYRKFEDFDEVAELKYVAASLQAVTRMMIKTAFNMEFNGPKEALTLVLHKFYLNGGFTKLNNYVQKFADALAASTTETEPKTSAARYGLLAVLDFYGHVVRYKTTHESLQTSVISVRDHRQADYFMPGQFVVEIRDTILPAVTKLWNSPAIETIGDAYVKKVIDIMRVALKSEGEDRAIHRNENASRRVQTKQADFSLRSTAGLAGVQNGVQDTRLAREAVYRCNNHEHNARDYANLRLPPRSAPRFPIPEGESNANADAPADAPAAAPAAATADADRPTSSSHSVEMADANHAEENPSDDPTPPEVTTTATEDPPSEDDDEDDDEEERAGAIAGLSSNITDGDLMQIVGGGRMQDILNLTNDGTVGGPSAAPPAQDTRQPFTTIEDLDEKRKALRDSLIDRCLEILSAVPGVTFELSDLIQATVAKSGEGANPRADIGSTLVSSLMSLKADEPSKEAGIKIAAYAHLVALILQDRDFFDSTLDELKDYFDALVSWVQLGPDQKTEDAPWLEMVLLIMERVLAEDEQPVEINWDPPPSDDPLKALPEPKVPEPVVSTELRTSLFDALVDILPKIGKTTSLALSVSRVLVMLTRKRELAMRLSEKQSMRKLFVMIRQLNGSVDEKVQSCFMLILRHMVEDEQMIRQIMRTEIKATIDTARNSRGMDTSTYTRTLYHLVLRDPELFVDVTKDMLEIGRFDGNPHRAQALMLKREKPAEKAADQPEDKPTEENKEVIAQPSVEAEGAGQTSAEVKPPTVESADGVVSFLLRELSNWRDVEDRATATPKEGQTTPQTNGEASTVDVDMADASDAPTPNGTPGPALAPEPAKTAEKPTFKPEEHSGYIYRCFLLQCLSELLLSYGRTKVEFINFSRKPETQPATPSKPRAGTLNYLLNTLIPVGTLEHKDDISHKKKLSTSNWATTVVISLCAKTPERSSRSPRGVETPVEEDTDLIFVRKFVLEHALRSFKEATASTEPLDQRYSRLLALGELFNRMLNKSERDASGADPTHKQQVGRLMYEKSYIAALTSAIAEIDLNFPNAKRAVKYILSPLRQLTELGVVLSQTTDISSSSAPGTSTEEDEISSATSVSDGDDGDREDRRTPDLLRNTALGMLESGADHDDDDTSGDDEDEDDDDDEEMDDFEEQYEEMYGEDEEMPEHGDVVSDEDEDEGTEGMGDVEGMPGDIDMDLGVIVPDGEDGDEMDEDDDDEDDESGDDDDFPDHIDEITGDDENASMGEGDEDDWEEDDGADFEAEAGENGSPHGGPLEHIAHVIGADVSDPGDEHEHDHIVRVDMGDGEDDYFEDEMAPEDEDEEEEEIDYENDVVYEPEIEEDDDDEQEMGWDFDAPVAPAVARPHHHHHHHHAPLRGLGGMFDMLGGGDAFRTGPPVGRTHRNPYAPRGEDDGTNPLLHREGSINASRDRGDFMETPLGRSGRRGFGFPPVDLIQDLVASVGQGGRAGTVNINLGNMPRGAGNPFPAGVFQLQGGPGGSTLIDIDPNRPLAGQLGPRFGDMSVQRADARGSGINNEAQAVEFHVTSTISRWQEEARMLFGGKHLEKATRVIHALLRLLVPPAMQAKLEHDKAERERREAEEKAREEERKKAEAERAEREAREKQEREEQEAREREEAARRAEEEREAQAESAAHSGNVEMEGVEQAQGEEEPAEQPSAAPEPEQPPVERITTSIRGREVDITSLGIDRDFLEAIPEDMREEVIMQQLQQQRTQAAQTGEQPTEISQEFLEALPRDIQQELLRQETSDRRRREHAEARRQAAQAGNAAPAAQPEEMNNADFMAMLDPALRQAVLMDADENTLAALPEDIQAEARTLLGDRLPHRHGVPGIIRRDGALARVMEAGADRNAQAHREASRQRRPIVQMLDKPGVATLLRLMFVSLHHKAKSNLHNILSDVCKNTQNRAEVISILLSILQDGTADIGAVERSFAQLSLKAKQLSGPKTPQPLKRTPTGLDVTPTTELSPLNIVQHCLATLNALAGDNAKVPSFFLTEHETVTSQKLKAAKKGKGRESKASKYPLNALLALLDRKLITENTGVMEALATLLSRVTHPLTILLRRAKEAQGAEKAAAPAEPAVATTEAEAQPSAAGDVPMAETSAEPAAEAAAGEQASGSEPKPEGEGAKEIAKPEEKKHKELTPPEVPDENIRLVVNILAARECPSKTFSDTLDIIKNLSAIPGAKEVFGKELVRQAQELGQTVLVDLEELAKQINSAETSTDLQGLALANFSSAGSKQRMLLRVLLALDHLFDPKRTPNIPASTAPMDPKLKDDVLALLYESSTFEKLWNNLTSCLAAIRARGNMVNVATILLPLIESLMVVCRNSTLKEGPTSAAVTSPVDTTPSTPPPETRMEGLFFRFTEDNRKILNELIRNNPKLMGGNLSILAKNSKVLEFDNKRTYFSRKVHNRGEVRVSHPTLQLNIRRDQVFLDSFKSLYYKSGDEIKYGKLNIRFHGEEGIDAGGVSREWFGAMARQMFNPDYALFNPVASDRTTFHPNPFSDVNNEHLLFFRFIGRIIGKALYEGRVLDCHFSRAVYRRILGRTVSLKDMESLDLDYYRSLVWILENDITDVTFETFSIDIDRFGASETVDLVENGREIPVTEENKHDYVQRVVEHRLINSVEPQLEKFLEGFHEIIPQELIAIFNEQELELLISGLPDIDVDDWKNQTEYHNYQATSPQVQWFWRALRSFDKEEKAKLLQFVTGTSKVPLNGFKELEGMNGFAKFNIHRDYSSKEKLPSSHTCFNQLDLPEYESYEHLRQQLYTAITAGSEYFGFA